MSSLTVGTVYRYARPYSPAQPEVDGLPNYFHRVYTPGQTLPLLEAGINRIRPVREATGVWRVPAILISSSPHKVGSEQTPWQDTFDVDHGLIRYFGDNKTPSRDPGDAPGNRALLEAFRLHSSPLASTRGGAVPIVFFQRVAHEGRSKGNVRFQGFGIVTRAERITQYDRHAGAYFANYVFDFAVFSLAPENEVFDWAWIGMRRDKTQTLPQTTMLAPTSWKVWLRDGPPAVERCRRRVSRLLVTAVPDQRPARGSREAIVLTEIYSFYSQKKTRFEALAAEVTRSIMRRAGAQYQQGWVTPPTSDGGTDFVGRLDVGTGFGSTKLVVLGQAKCESPDAPTGGNHVARTVARLRRGWIGVYVTTSYFSEKVQREVIEDQYPILLVNGLDLAREVDRLALESGFAKVGDFLRDLDSRYESMIRQRRPEEILMD